MFADLMLRWMSELGSGRLDELRNRLRWLARTSDLPASSQSAGRWLRDISALGHAEVDWEKNKWFTTPAALVRLPAADGLAVLVGGRTPRMLEALAESEVYVQEVQPEPSGQDLPVPTCVFVRFDDVISLEEASRNAHALYVGCAAELLAERLRPVVLGAAAASPGLSNDTVERLAGEDRMKFEPTDRTDSDGLYRAKLQGRRRHLYRQNGVWFWCDLAAGVFTELKRSGNSVMRWRAEASTGRDRIGTLFVDWGAPLPPLQARALVLCSGLPPAFHHGAKTAEYANVPRTVAMTVAASLHQTLKVL